MKTNVQIFAFKKDGRLSLDIKERLFSFLKKDERVKISKFKRKEDRETALISRGFLKKLLSQELKLPEKEIIFNYSKHERPFLKNFGENNFDFNVSHSGDWIVWILAESGRVGIDIEEVRPIEEDLVNSCFTPEEKDYIYGNQVFDLERFFELWTLKEAFVKADGQGLSYSLQDFYFQTSPQIRLQGKPAGQSWYFKQYNLDPNYKMGACSSRNIFPTKVDVISNSGLLLRL